MIGSAGEGYLRCGGMACTKAAMRNGLVLEILLKVLYDLGRGRFCWLFGDFLKAMRSRGRMSRREGPICCHLAVS